MEPLTLEQVKQLQSWASERDTILNEISSAKQEREKLAAQNKALAESNSDIQIRIYQLTARAQELEIKEKELANKVSLELSDLLIQKSQLQAELSSLKNDVDSLHLTRYDLEVDIDRTKNTLKVLNDNASLLTSVVDHVTKVSSSNKFEIDQLMKDLKKEVQQVIDLNASNVEKTNYVINELPHIFFALQRQVPIKKTTIL